MPGPYAKRSADELRDLVKQSLPRLDRIVRWVASRHCLRDDEVDELRSRLHLRLLENDYRVLRRFSGRSSLETYLGCVAQNVARDYRIERWGRWRPSAAADQAGIVAVQLEALLYRDGFSLDEAIEILRANRGVRLGRRQLVELAAHLPPRGGRREETLEKVGDLPGTERANGTAREANGRAAMRRIGDALRAAMRELSVEDRLILRMHYDDGLTIASIASALQLRQRPLYGRRDRCLKHLRRALDREGLDAAEALAAVGWSGAALEIFHQPDDQQPGSQP